MMPYLLSWLLAVHSLLLQDPLADGAVIHTAATRALQHGTTLDKVIDMVAKVAPELKAPLVLFTYYNPIIRRGMDKFCAQIKAAGAAGAGVQNCFSLCSRSSSTWCSVIAERVARAAQQ
jgi:tryptophan synthase alpha subunit